jgi:chromosome partitioning protein
VLLIDCDPQGNSSSWIHPEPLKAELAGVLLGNYPVDAAIANSTVPGLSIIPTAGIGGSLKTWDEGVGQRKPFALRELIRDVSSMGFAFCIMDLSPSFGVIERAALVAADEVITPIMPDPFGISGLEIFAHYLQHLRKDLETQKPDYKRIVLNALDGRIRQHDEILKQVEKDAKGFHLYTLPVDQVFRKAETEHVSIFETGTAKKETILTLEKLSHALQGGI